MTERKSDNKSKDPQPIQRVLKEGVEKELGRLEESYRQKKKEFSHFLERFHKKVNCILHEQCTASLLEDDSFAHFFRTGQAKPIYGICSTEQLEILVNETHGKWLKMGVPRKVVDATFENYETKDEKQKKVKDRCMAFMARGRGFLLLIGLNGTGKTHLAAACMKRHGYGEFVIQSDLIDKLRETYNGGTNKRDLVLQYQTSKLLVIDEIDADLKGDDIAPFLYQILNYRYDNDLITILTTNEDLSTLLSILGARIEDRIASNYVVGKLDWPSYRKANRAS